MGGGRRPRESELPGIVLETWSEPAAAGVAAERSGLGGAACGTLLVALAVFSVLVLHGQPHPAVEAPEAPVARTGPKMGVVAEPQQFVARTATLMPPGRARPVPLSGRELLAKVGAAGDAEHVELSLGRYSELLRGSVTIDHLVWVLVEKSALANRVRIFDAVDGEALVEFSGPPGVATCPIEIGASLDHCASVRVGMRRLVLSYLTEPHQY